MVYNFYVGNLIEKAGDLRLICISAYLERGGGGGGGEDKETF